MPPVVPSLPPLTRYPMLRADIAIAALDDQIEQRIRIAAQLLAAYRIKAVVRAWDGTRCSLLATDLSDAYGRQACQRARGRGTPVLAFSADAGQAQQTGLICAAEGSLAPALAHAIRDLLQPTPTETTPTTVAGPQPALCRLADPEFSGRAVDATCNGRLVHIRPEEGRVYAPTFSDLLSARDTFSSGEWTLSTNLSADARHGDGANRSLEAFLLQSAFSGREQLPAFPKGRYRLKDWPDIGSAPELVGALKVAKTLLRAPADADELRALCGMDARDVNASLWAYRAANLLSEAGEETRSAQPAQPVGAFSGMLARIAQRFGLGRD